MELLQLGYFGIAASDVNAWRSYAEDFLGMQVSETDYGALLLRMDERYLRFLIEPATHDGVSYLGFEVADRRALELAQQKLIAAGLDVHAGSSEEDQRRHVESLISLLDPDGNRIELYCGPKNSPQPFSPARPIGGFRTGELGVGHIALATTNFDDMIDFYQGLLAFRLSDYVPAAPFRASFFHINPRHHSLAVIESDVQQVHHLMVEYDYMDDVGRLYDMALKTPEMITVSLGRHSNDHVLSFYSRTPGGFMLEAGWAGRLIDENTWEPEELYGPSIWGHERSWLSPEAQVVARQILETTAAKGVLEPTEVVASPAFNLRENTNEK